MTFSGVRGGIVLWSLCAVALLLLARALPARGFFSGDSGVKLIVALNAIAHPAHPLGVPLPIVGDAPAPFVDPFFHVDGDRAYAATPDLFPLLSAPLIAAFGLRGAYVLPAAGFLVALAVIALIGVRLDSRRSPFVIMLATGACTPLLFYALEFWEHTAAIAAAALGTALLVTGGPAREIAAGALLGVATLLRPEGACYAVAVVAAAPLLRRRFGVASATRIVAGAVVAIAPMLLVSAIASGRVLGSHISRNMSGVSAAWWSTRIEYVRAWIGPWWAAGLAALTIGAALWSSRGSATSRARAAFLALALAAALAVVAAMRIFDRGSLWNAAPSMAALAALFAVRDTYDGSAFLTAAMTLYALLVVIATPSDGGAQWGPRYLLFAFIPAPILLTDVVAVVRQHARVAGACVAALLLAASLDVGRNAYKQLRTSKRIYANLVDAVDRDTAPGALIVTDVWWFDQVIAALSPTRSVLTVDSPSSAADALDRLARAKTGFYVATSADEPSATTLNEADLTRRFMLLRRTRIPERSMTLERFAVPR